MMRLSEICVHAVVTCSRDTTADELARTMRERHVGDVVVVEPSDGGVRPVGIVTDRDLVVKVLALGVAPADCRAADLMGVPLVTAFGSDSVYDAIWHMRSRGIRRLPVVDVHSRLLGIVTRDDLSEVLAQDLSALARVSPRQTQNEQARQSA
jgi:CBS domain-containing protein